MEENKTYIPISDDEISLKDLLLKLIEFYHEIIKNWKLVIISIFVFSGILFYRAFMTPITYPAKLTFMLNEDNSGSLGALGGLAASFGIGGMTKGEFNLDKMLALSKSRNIIQQVLFEKGEIDGKNDFYANHLIQKYNLVNKWQKTEILKEFNGFTHQNLSKFSKIENTSLKYIHSMIVGSDSNQKILSSTVNESTGIVELKTSTTSEELSINMVNLIYEKLSHFYVDKTIEQQQYTFAITKEKTDSLKQALHNTQYNLLKFKDTNRNLSLRQFEAQELKLQRDAQVLTLAYGESLKNQEMADFALKSKTPFIQSIDLPISPIRQEKESKIKALIMGSFLGGFLSTMFILGRKIIQDTLYNP